MSNFSINKRVVLIAHKTEDLKENSHLCKQFLYEYDKYVERLKYSLKTISEGITVYAAPKEFLKRIVDHSNDIVFSIWGIGGSRNKKSLIPTICEVQKVIYYGGDCYVNALCQDKHLSNLFAKEYGLATPKQFVVSGSDAFRYNSCTEMLRFPVIVKPTVEGESIGVDQNSICHDFQSALSLAITLNEKFKQDIIIEEYLEGIEINIVIIGINDNIHLFEQVLLSHTNDIYDYHKKRNSGLKKYQKVTGNYLDDSTIKVMKQIFLNFKNAEILRIDGKIKDGKFYFIEFTQDPGLREGGVIHTAFTRSNLPGNSYEELLCFLINNTIQNKGKY